MTQDPIETFLNGQPFAVVGASENRSKYGNKVLRAYQQAGLNAFPVNPNAKEIEGQAAFKDLHHLAEHVAEQNEAGLIHGVSIITPPAVTEIVISQVIELGVRNVWMQPGAESSVAIARAKQAGANVISNGPCILVRLRFRDES